MLASMRLPLLATIYEGLKQHTTTLKHLHIHGARFSLNRTLNIGHRSFRDLSCLQTMEIDITMLLGWKDCWFSCKPPHVGPSLDPRALGTLLPDSLQELVLYIDNDYRIQKPPGYMHEIVLGIIDEADRLTCLKTIRLSPEYVHCWSCSHADGRVWDSEVEEDEEEVAETIVYRDKVKRLANSRNINFAVSKDEQNRELPYW